MGKSSIGEPDSTSAESGQINDTNNVVSGTNGGDAVGTDIAGADPLEAITKRRRGRPRKSAAEFHGADADSRGGETKPRRTSAINSATGGAKANQKLVLESLASKVFGAHQFIAAITGNKLLAITEQEALTLAKAGQDVAQYHSLEIDPKYLAYGSLIFACASIYVPRVIMLGQQMRMQKAQQQAQQMAAKTTQNTGTQTADVFASQQPPIRYQ